MAAKKKSVKKSTAKKAKTASTVCSIAIENYAHARGKLCDAYEGTAAEFKSGLAATETARLKALSVCR